MLKGQRRDVRSSGCHFIKIDGGRKKGGAQGWRSSSGEGQDPEDKWWEATKSLKHGWKAFTRPTDLTSHPP